MKRVIGKPYVFCNYAHFNHIDQFRNSFNLYNLLCISTYPEDDTNREGMVFLDQGRRKWVFRRPSSEELPCLVPQEEAPFFHILDVCDFLKILRKNMSGPLFIPSKYELLSGMWSHVMEQIRLRRYYEKRRPPVEETLSDNIAKWDEIHTFVMGLEEEAAVQAANLSSYLNYLKDPANSKK